MNRNLGRALVAVGVGAAAVLGTRWLARSLRRFEFRDRVVLITGGSRGLGLRLAEYFGDEGARVALCARDADELRRAAEQLAQRGVEVMTVVCDVALQGQVRHAIEQVHARWGDVDVLVNNAGIIQVGPLETMTEDDYAEAMRIHFWGPLYATLAVLPAMRRRKLGRIVNITSIGGKISVPHLLPYSASKFALVGFSEGLRSEVGRDGVYVTTVVPGLMRTGSPLNAKFKGEHQAEYAWFTVSDSLPGLSISAEQAARQIVEACRYGDAEVVLSAPAKLAVLAQGAAPGLVADLLSLTARLLPKPGGIGQQTALGRDSHPRWLPEWLIGLTTQAARRNNQLAPR